jgi:hypothetical protein
MLDSPCGPRRQQDSRHNLTVKLTATAEIQTQLPEWIFGARFRAIPSTFIRETRELLRTHSSYQEISIMAVGAKIAKTADRKKVMDTTKSTDCPKCGKPTRIVKRVKDRERGVPGGIYISCSGCEFFEKL